MAAAEEEVARRAAGEHAGHRTHPDDQQQQARERLVDAVPIRRELDAEGLDTREEVVAEALATIRIVFVLIRRM